MGQGNTGICMAVMYLHVQIKFSWPRFTVKSNAGKVLAEEVSNDKFGCGECNVIYVPRLILYFKYVLDPCPIGYIYTSDWEPLQKFYPLKLIRDPTMTLL